MRNKCEEIHVGVTPEDALADWAAEEVNELRAALASGDRAAALDAFLDLLGVCIVGIGAVNTAAHPVLLWYTEHQASRGRPPLCDIVLLEQAVLSFDKERILSMLTERSFKRRFTLLARLGIPFTKRGA